MLVLPHAHLFTYILIMHTNNKINSIVFKSKHSILIYIDINNGNIIAINIKIIKFSK